jgi:hypothetical protein
MPGMAPVWQTAASPPGCDGPRRGGRVKVRSAGFYVLPLAARASREA